MGPISNDHNKKLNNEENNNKTNFSMNQLPSDIAISILSQVTNLKDYENLASVFAMQKSDVRIKELGEKGLHNIKQLVEKTNTMLEFCKQICDQDSLSDSDKMALMSKLKEINRKGLLQILDPSSSTSQNPLSNSKLKALMHEFLGSPIVKKLPKIIVDKIDLRVIRELIPSIVQKIEVKDKDIFINEINTPVKLIKAVELLDSKDYKVLIKQKNKENIDLSLLPREKQVDYLLGEFERVIKSSTKKGKYFFDAPLFRSEWEARKFKNMMQQLAKEHQSYLEGSKYPFISKFINKFSHSTEDNIKALTNDIYSNHLRSQSSGIMDINSYGKDQLDKLYSAAQMSDEQLLVLLLSTVPEFSTSGSYITTLLPKKLLEAVEGKIQKHSKIEESRINFLEKELYRNDPQKYRKFLNSKIIDSFAFSQDMQAELREIKLFFKDKKQFMFAFLKKTIENTPYTNSYRNNHITEIPDHTTRIIAEVIDVILSDKKGNTQAQAALVNEILQQFESKDLLIYLIGGYGQIQILRRLLNSGIDVNNLFTNPKEVFRRLILLKDEVIKAEYIALLYDKGFDFGKLNDVRYSQSSNIDNVEVTEYLPILHKVYMQGKGGTQLFRQLFEKMSDRSQEISISNKNLHISPWTKIVDKDNCGNILELAAKYADWETVEWILATDSDLAKASAASVYHYAMHKGNTKLCEKLTKEFDFQPNFEEELYNFISADRSHNLKNIENQYENIGAKPSLYYPENTAEWQKFKQKRMDALLSLLSSGSKLDFDKLVQVPRELLNPLKHPQAAHFHRNLPKIDWENVKLKEHLAGLIKIPEVKENVQLLLEEIERKLSTLQGQDRHIINNQDIEFAKSLLKDKKKDMIKFMQDLNLEQKQKELDSVQGYLDSRRFKGDAEELARAKISDPEGILELGVDNVFDLRAMPNQGRKIEKAKLPQLVNNLPRLVEAVSAIQRELSPMQAEIDALDKELLAKEASARELKAQIGSLQELKQQLESCLE
ncbi:MAG: hypothetical protein K0S74_1310 [Chlamydiales bacterium]|jgi:hypothetical protein|nr:hypothetical protein [Chlamydiales bacterium]